MLLPRNCCVVTWFVDVTVTLYLIQNLMFLREMTRKAGLLKANAEPAKAPRERDQREGWEVAQLHQFIIWSWIHPVSTCFFSICCLIFIFLNYFLSPLHMCFKNFELVPFFPIFSVGLLKLSTPSLKSTDSTVANSKQIPVVSTKKPRL